MSRQTECIDGFLKRAQADQTVYVTDVRRVFDEVGEKAFHVHAHLYEGAVEVFDMSVPESLMPPTKDCAPSRKGSGRTSSLILTKQRDPAMENALM